MATNQHQASAATRSRSSTNKPMSTFTALDEHYMRRAIELAARGMFTTRANPRVGCVLVRDDVVIGEGYHVRPGEGHAEVNALASVNGDAVGATAYVSLEPCAHFGRTPPCSHALTEARVRNVVIASVDPNPRVDGGGIQYLRDHNIGVRTGLLDAEARALNPGFFSRMQRGRPWLRGKIATSLDGRTALADGCSQWITGPDARADVQRYRARACAILTGADTVIADDPSLTVRVDSQLRPVTESSTDIAQPLRVVVDGRARIGTDAKLMSLPGAVLVACREDAPPDRMQSLEAAGADVVKLPARGDHIDLDALFTVLGQREINEVHTEAGPHLLGALLQHGLLDELLWYLAPNLLGPDARPGISFPPLTSMQARPEFGVTDCTRIGSDVRLTLMPSPD